MAVATERVYRKTIDKKKEQVNNKEKIKRTRKEGQTRSPASNINTAKKKKSKKRGEGLLFLSVKKVISQTVSTEVLRSI